MQLIGQGALVNHFLKPVSEKLMHLKGGTNDLLSDILVFQFSSHA